MLTCPYCERPLLNARNVEAGAFRMTCQRRHCRQYVEVHAAGEPELAGPDFRPYRCQTRRCLEPLFESNALRGRAEIVCHRCHVMQTILLAPVPGSAGRRPAVPSY